MPEEQFNCLMSQGGPLDDEVRNELINTARALMRGNNKKVRLTKGEHGFSGFLSTDYKLGTMGQISGFEFKAEFCHEGTEHVVSFLVKPTKKAYDMHGTKWVRAPFFCVKTSDSSRN